MVDVCVVIYLDDILVFSRNADDHAHDLRRVLSRLRQHRLYAKPSKCLFAQSSVPFLGHVVSATGIHTDPSKISSLTAWPQPQCAAQLASFLGLANYYRRYVHNFSTVASPLYDLLKRPDHTKFTRGSTAKASQHQRRLSSKPSTQPWTDTQWTQLHTLAFTTLKTALSSPPALAYPDPQLPFHISADASNTGVGAVLWQHSDTSNTRARRPIAFLSRKLAPHERHWGMHLREGLAFVTAFRQWRHYLEGAPGGVFVHSDHHSLKRLLTQPQLCRVQASWLDTLQGITHIEYNRGSSPHHVPADALSR
jgi:hypothetical protein